MDVKVVIANLEAFRRAVQLTDVGTRTRTQQAIEKGTRAVAAAAKARAPKVSGEMASTVRAEFSKNRLTGFVKVGYGKLLRRSKASTSERKAKLKQTRKAKGSKSGQGSYAPVIERGDRRRGRQPKPFLIPSLVQQRPLIQRELEEAPSRAANAGGLTT